MKGFAVSDPARIGPPGSLLEAAPIAIVAVDEKGLSTSLNEQAAHLSAYDRDELLGKSCELSVNRSP